MPRTQRMQSGWTRGFPERRGPAVGPDKGVAPHQAVGPVPGPPSWAAQKGRNKWKSHSLCIPRRVFGASAAHPDLCVCVWGGVRVHSVCV